MIPEIRKAVQEDQDISDNSLNVQFQKLLQQPLLDLEQSSQQKQPMVIIIDALDECDQRKDIEHLLQLLPQAQQVESIRLRFFLTSRPELPTDLGFRKIENRHHRHLVLHEIPEPVIKRDIHILVLILQIVADQRGENRPSSIKLAWAGHNSESLKYRLFCLSLQQPYVVLLERGHGHLTSVWKTF